MNEKNKAAIHRWFEEVWNQGREAAIYEMFPRNGVAHGLGDSEVDVHGPDEFKPLVDNIRGLMPDLHVSIEDIFEEGDRAAVRLTLEGTHTGRGLGVEPTGRRVRIQGIIIARMIDGQIVEAWNSYDQLGLLRQIGALPSLAGRNTFLSANRA